MRFQRRFPRYLKAYLTSTDGTPILHSMNALRILLFFLFLMGMEARAQNMRDSLVEVWSNTAVPDTQRLAAAHRLVWRVYLHRSPDTARYYAEQQLQLAQSKGLLKHVSSAYNSIGVTHHIQGDLEDAIRYYRLSLEADEERAKAAPRDVAAVEGIAASYANLSVLYQQIGDLGLSMEGYDKALFLFDSLEAKGASVNGKIADVQNNIGLAHETQGATDDALPWFRRAMERYEREEPGTALASTLSNIGNALHRLAEKETDSAVRDSLATEAGALHQRSLRVRQQIGDRRGEANALNNLAAHLQQRAAWTDGPTERRAVLHEAETLYRQSANLAAEVQDRVAMASTWANLAENLIRQGRTAEAVGFAEKALALGQEIGNAESVVKATEKLHIAYKSLGRSKEALAMFELYTAMRDSVRNDENTRVMLRQQYAYEYAQREAVLVLEQEKKELLAVAELRRRSLQRNVLMAGLGMLAVVAVVILRQRNHISREKARSEELLLNILPEEVAEELKEKGKAEAKHFDAVTILFTDFKGFTQLSEKVTPQQLVHDLNECFSAFDRICGKHGIEKIKTIGDAYMAAGGIPRLSTTHAADTIKAALEMRDFIAEGKVRKEAKGLPYFEIRIGIHTGPVVAGIVGVKKFQYDIWGDTVNTASRMESSGEEGMVNISEATYTLVRDALVPLGNGPLFTFTPRGKVVAKGKGMMEMFFVGLS